VDAVVAVSLAIVSGMYLCAKQVRRSFGCVNTVLHAVCIAAILNIPFKPNNDNAETLCLIILLSSLSILLVAIFWRYARIFERKDHQLFVLTGLILVFFLLLNRTVVPL
jgi:hypothetical protein